jgi:hypothetical protein
MFIERKQDLSVYHFIKQIFEDQGLDENKITIVDGFPTGEISIPTISVDNEFLTVEGFELGNRFGLDIRTWYIDIFAENKSRRDEFAYLIKNSVQSDIPVYDYDQGFPPTVVDQLGMMKLKEVSGTPIKVMPDLVTTLYWRFEIKIIAYYEQKTT